MYEFLKGIFGETEDGQPVALTYEQLVEKLNANKELHIVNLADGGYVAKDKFDAKLTELDGVNEQLNAANETIQSYKDMDIEGIKQSITDWEQKYNNDTDALRRQLAEQEKNHSLDMFLGGYQFSSKAAKDGIRADFISKNFPYEDGKFIGAKEYMEGLMGNDDYKAAFVQKQSDADPTNGNEPKPKFSDPNPTKPTPKPKIGLAELMLRKNQNPNAEVKFE